MTTGLKIIFAGTPEFAAASLRALLDSQHQVIAAYTQPDRPAGRGQSLRKSPVKKIALKASIPIYQPKSFNEDECLILNNLNADVMVVSAYGLLLPADVLNSPSLGCINIHASLLPKWRGAAPIQRAIISGDKETGITIMQMVEELDAGPVLEQIKCAIKADDTGASLHDRLADISAKEIAGVLQRLKDQKLNPLPQDDNKASYAKKLSKQEAQINWQESAVQIERKIRAYNSWPVAYTYLNGTRVRIWEAQTSTTKTAGTPGHVVVLDNEGIEVTTGKGTLTIKTLQLSGGKVISAKDFNNAHDVSGQSFAGNAEVVKPAMQV